MQTWPVFWTARHEVVAASSVHWPDESWSQLSPAVRDILEGSLTGERRQALHADLLPLTTVPTGLPFSPATAPAPEIEGTTEREVKGLATSTAQQVVTLSQWAMETSNWTVITHVLAGDASALRLLPVAEVLIRSEEWQPARAWRLEGVEGVDLVEPSDPDVSSSERGSMAEGDAGDAPRLGSLAQRVLEESRWIPDEEERAILVRAIQRLRQKVASESVAERQKQFQKLASQAALQIKPRGEAATPPVVERRSQGRPAAAEQSPFRPSNVETNLAEYSGSRYRLRKGEEVESPPSPRRRGILRTSSITPPAINVSEVTEAMTQLPIHSTTAAAAFGRFHFKGADAGDSTPTSPSSPSSPIAKKAPLRLPVKQRASAVSIADEEDVTEAPELRPEKPEETDVSLTSNVRGLQVQMERLEEVQSDLLQQLRKAEGRFRSSLEKQETLEEHCRDLREQLKGPTPAQLQASNARPNEKLEEMLARLSLQQDQLEAEMAQMKSRQEQSQRSWEDRFREAQQSTEETSLEVLRMAELGQRMSEGMETAREEFGEQIRVLRERSDTKLASLEEMMGWPSQSLGPGNSPRSQSFFCCLSVPAKESFRNQLDMSMGELKKTMSAGASELRALEELTTRSGPIRTAAAASLRGAMSQGLETSREEVWKQIRALRDASGAFVATRLGLSIVGGGARDCNPLVFSSCAQEAQEAWQSQLDDSISELSQKLATFSESASKFDQLETRLGNFEDFGNSDCMETRRAAHQRETHRLFTELQTSFDKLEGLLNDCADE
eukprot:g30306.t1